MLPQLWSAGQMLSKTPKDQLEFSESGSANQSSIEKHDGIWKQQANWCR